MRLLMSIMILALLVLTAGCSQPDQAVPSSGQQPAEPTSATTAAIAPTPAPVATPEAQSSTEESFLPKPVNNRNTALQTTGVPVCDQFAFAVQQCLAGMAGTRGEGVRERFDRQLTHWKKALASGTSRVDIATQCVHYRTSIKRRLHAMGCRL